MKNIHILPTDKPSRFTFIKYYSYYRFRKDEFINNDTHQNQNIYITSDEEIKEGDWVIQVNFEKTNIQLIQCITKFQTKIANDKDGSFTKNKIILTTDPTLIADGVQSIDDDFLEWFVKNPSCEEVGVELKTKQLVRPYDVYNETVSYYKIIIPQEEPMKQTAVDWAFEQLDEQVFRIDHLERRINISISFEDMMTLKKEAKEMEKEQIIEFTNSFYDECVMEGGSLNQSAEEYYKETYGKDA